VGSCESGECCDIARFARPSESPAVGHAFRLRESYDKPYLRTEGTSMQRITRNQARKYAFDWRDEPLLRVRPGESFEIETYDASTGYFRSEEDRAVPALRPGFDRVPPLVNPIGGPVWLEGAERGDTLVVTIEEILVADYSWIAIGPRRGPLGESTRWPELSSGYTTRILRHEPGPSGVMP